MDKAQLLTNYLSGKTVKNYIFDAAKANSGERFNPSGKSKYRFNVEYSNNVIDEFRLPPENPDFKNTMDYTTLMGARQRTFQFISDVAFAEVQERANARMERRVAKFAEKQNSARTQPPPSGRLDCNAKRLKTMSKSNKGRK